MNEYVLAALIGLSMALVKLVEKMWEARTNGKPTANGTAALLTVMQGEMKELRIVAAKQTELAERMDRRLEKLAQGQIRLLERSKTASGEGRAMA